MDSRLFVQSEYGKGSEFSFDIRQTIVDRAKTGDIAEAYKQSQVQIDGYKETLHAMKNLEGNLSEGKPCIALTANAISGVKKMYLEEGFTDYLSKPVNPEKLEAMIRAYLPKELIEVAPDEENFSQNTESDSETKDFLSKLREIDGINVDSALENCGNAEILLSTVRRYVSAYGEQSKNIEKFFSDSDWKNYGTLVHSLKSTSRLIGAKKLSELAFHLEESTDKNDESEIRKNHDSLMEQYRSCVEKLKPLVAELEKCHLPEEYKELFEKIRKCVESVNYKELKNLLMEADLEN